MNKLAYFRSQGVKVMNLIENETGKMMSEIDQELERNFWANEAAGDEKRLMYSYFALAALHDSLNMEE